MNNFKVDQKVFLKSIKDIDPYRLNFSGFQSKHFNNIITITYIDKYLVKIKEDHETCWYFKNWFRPLTKTEEILFG